MGNRVPHALKMFLLALAIFDDLGSIVIIAAFYTDNLTWTSLALAVVGIVALVFMNVRGVTQPAPYLLTGVYIWVCVLKSGVHATLAGVVVALATPFAGKDPGQPLAARAARGEPAPLDRLWRPAAIRIRQCRRGAQRPWLAEAVGAGGARCAPWPAARQAARHPRRDLPRRGQQNRRQAAREARWDQMVAIALLRGIGFTMSLFIGTLAFGDPLHAAEVRLGVLSGSVFSASLALIVLALTPRLPVAP